MYNKSVVEKSFTFAVAVYLKLQKHHGAF